MRDEKLDLELPSRFQERVVKALSGFRAALSHSQQVAAEQQEDLPSIERLIDGFRVEHSNWAVAQESVADDFNLFRVMGIEHKELIHSRLLAWLLDARIEHGSHAQRNLGFRLFLKEFQIELNDPTGIRGVRDYADGQYQVYREVASTNSRVDIEISATKRFIIHIENKILSDEAEEQTIKEWADMNKRADILEVPLSNRHAFFLTLDGGKAQEPNFRPVRWDRIASILDEFAKLAQPPVVKLFIVHYAEALRNLIASQAILQEFPT